MQYDSHGRLVKITNDEAGNDVLQSYAYDNYGNRVSDNNRSYTWTRGRLLASAGSTTYAYDYTGARCRKVNNGNTTEYYYDNGRLICEDGSKPMMYYYDTEGLIGAFINGSMYRVVRDMSGSVRYIVDIAGRIAAQYKYDAHGVCKVYDGNNVERTESNFIGNIFPIRWKGYYYDTETGLYYNGGRYYDPETGKYLDACGIVEAIAEEQLDRNDIMCDNVNELMPYICTVLIGLVKDPASGESDSTSSGSGIPWWVRILIGLGTVFVGALVTAFTAGTGISAAAAFGSALLSSTVQVGISAGISAEISGIMSVASGGGFFAGVLDGFIDGVMWGGIFAGGAQILGGAMRMAANAGVATGRHGGITLGKTGIKILSPDKNNWVKAGGTLIKFGKILRFDIGVHWGFHMHILSSPHLPIGIMIAVLLSQIID